MVVTIDDILDQLWSENTRLLKELVFANKCLNILDELKSELNLIYKKFETQLNTEDKFNQLRHQLNYICDQRHDKDFAESKRKTCDISDTNDTKVVDKSDSEDIQEVVDNNQVIDNHKDVTVVNTSTDTLITSSSSSSSSSNGSQQQSGQLLLPMKPQQSVTDNRIQIKRRFLIIRPNNVGHKVSDFKAKSSTQLTTTKLSLISLSNNTTTTNNNNNNVVQTYCRQMSETNDSLLPSDLAPKELPNLVVNNGLQLKCKENNGDNIIMDNNNNNENSLTIRSIQTIGKVGSVRDDRTVVVDGIKNKKILTKSDCFDSTTNSYICRLNNCNKSYKNLKRFLAHRKICKPTVPKIQKKKLILDNNEKYKCRYDGCDKNFRNRSGLSYHKILTHERHTIKWMKCQYTDCQYKCRRDYQMKKHLNGKHSDIKTFICSISGCFKAFKTSNSLQKHSLIHQNVVFRCDVDGCQRKFRHKTALTRHLIEHSNEPMLVCSVNGCPDKFFTDKERKKHLKLIHNKSYKRKWPMKRCEWPGCEYFGKRVARHMEVHTGEKRYPCVWPQCDKRFRDLGKLNDHMNIHNNVKPYACRWPGCDYRCANNTNIWIHMRQVHKTKSSTKS
ncbi:zinc finger protein 143-like [Oppia nitens]|uniref:zinc finger protein 143-like n=1 Tax=Oppia nitens TaxID=1686743 RepID=UPI0023D98381|nr:zinc finger protein 143-like [Oppia nitens]